MPAQHFWRSLTGVTALCLWFYSIGELPLATAVTLNYMSSVWMALFLVGGAIALGGARVDARLVCTVLVGFAGVALEALQPAIQRDQFWGGLAGLMSGVIAAMAHLQVTALGRAGEPAYQNRLLLRSVASSPARSRRAADRSGLHAHTAPGVALLLAVGVRDARAGRDHAGLRHGHDARRRQPAVHRHRLVVVFGVLWFDDPVTLLAIAGNGPDRRRRHRCDELRGTGPAADAAHSGAVELSPTEPRCRSPVPPRSSMRLRCAPRSAIPTSSCRRQLRPDQPAAGERDWLLATCPARSTHLDRDPADLLPPAGFHRASPLPTCSAFAATVGRWGHHAAPARRRDGPPGRPVRRPPVVDAALARPSQGLCSTAACKPRQVEAGGALSSEPAGPVRAQLPYPARAGSIPTVTAGELARRLGRASVVDARAANASLRRGRALALDSVAGHVPGALNRFFKDNLDPASGCFRSARQLADEFGALLSGVRALRRCRSPSAGRASPPATTSFAMQAGRPAGRHPLSRLVERVVGRPGLARWHAAAERPLCLP